MACIAATNNMDSKAAATRARAVQNLQTTSNYLEQHYLLIIYLQTLIVGGIISKKRSSSARAIRVLKQYGIAGER